MPPKARTPRGKAAAAVEEAPVALPMKRGRAAKADVIDAADVVAEPPKKRGRPAKAQAEEPVEAVPEPKKRGRKANVAPEPVIEEAPVVKKGRGRPKKDAVTAQEEAPVMSRGRPKKQAIAEPATPPKRGRPARAAVDLHRVNGSPRIGKRSSPRNNNNKVKLEPLARRLDPRMRSKLRTRLPAKKSEPAPQPAPKPTSRRGRPPKAAAAIIPPKQVAKPAKPLAPRKMRGHTVRQIPDRYIAQIDQYLHDLMEADESPVVEQQEDDIVAEDGQDALVSSEQDQDQYQEDSDGGIDMDGQQDGVQDEEDMQAVVAQQQENEYDEDSPEEANNDEFPEQLHKDDQSPYPQESENENDENAEPVHEEVEMSMHDVEMEADADGNTLLTTIDTDIVVRDDSPDDGEDPFNTGEEDGLLSETPRSPAAAIFS